MIIPLTGKNCLKQTLSKKHTMFLSKNFISTLRIVYCKKKKKTYLYKISD